MTADAKTGLKAVVALHQVNDHELLARVVYAEGLSTGFGDDQLVYDAIAWGVMNRVRLGDSSHKMQLVYGQGVKGVIFKKGQFNPAISGKSPFSKSFLCPDHSGHWRMAKTAAERAIKGTGNPFIQTPWEKQHNLSLVVNFYYPKSSQAKGPFAPWEGSKSLRFTGDITMDGNILPASKIRFYRLSHSSEDLKCKKANNQ